MFSIDPFAIGTPFTKTDVSLSAGFSMKMDLDFVISAVFSIEMVFDPNRAMGVTLISDSMSPHGF